MPAFMAGLHRARTLLCVAAGLLLLLTARQAAVAAPSMLRIVTLAPNLTELVYTAGAGDQLVGTVEYSDYPPEALQLPRVGDAFRIDYEALRALEPDLILAWQSGNPRDVIERLRQLGYKVEEFEARSLNDIALQIKRIGELAGTAAVAAKSAAKFSQGVGELRAAKKNAVPLRVFYQISSQPYFTVGARHVINELITLCGGTNVFAGIDAVAPVVTQESIIRANPEVIIAPVVAGSTEWQRDWLRWQSVSAVKVKALYAIDADFISRSTTRILKGGQQVCAALESARQAHAGY